MKKIAITWILCFLMTTVFSMKAGKGARKKLKNKSVQQEESFDSIIAQEHALNIKNEKKVAVAFEKWHALKYVLHVSYPEEVDEDVFMRVNPDHGPSAARYETALDDIMYTLRELKLFLSRSIELDNISIEAQKQSDLKDQYLQEVEHRGIDFSCYEIKACEDHNLCQARHQLNKLSHDEGSEMQRPKYDEDSQHMRLALQDAVNNIETTRDISFYYKAILYCDVTMQNMRLALQDAVNNIETTRDISFYYKAILYCDVTMQILHCQADSMKPNIQQQCKKIYHMKKPQEIESLFSMIASHLYQLKKNDAKTADELEYFKLYYQQCVEIQQAVEHDYTQLHATPESVIKKEKQATGKKVYSAAENNNRPAKNRKRRKRKKKQNHVQQDQEHQDASDSGAVAQLAHQAHDAVNEKQNEIDQEFAQMALASGFGSVVEAQKGGSGHKCKKPIQKNQPSKSPVKALITDFEDTLPYAAWHHRVSDWFNQPDDMLDQDIYCNLPDDEQYAAVQRHIFPSKVDAYIRKVGIRGFVTGGGVSYSIPGKLIRGDEVESGVFSWGVNNGLCYHRCFSRENQTVSPNVQDLIQRRTYLAGQSMKQHVSHDTPFAEQISKGCIVEADDKTITVIDNKADVKAVLYKPIDSKRYAESSVLS